MNFDYVARGLDIKAAAAELAINAPLWDVFQSRQTFPGSPHVNTKCIPLRGASSFVDSYKPDAKRRRTAFSHHLPRTTALVNRVLNGLPVATVGNVLAVSLQPESMVLPHIDTGEYPEHFDRFHIVLTSPQGNWFKVDGEYSFPEPGDVFFFNHRSTHSVGNPGKLPRIHLIVDVTLKD